MKRKDNGLVLVWCIMVLAMATHSLAQSLTDKLAEEETFYQNFGKTSYTKLKIEKDVVGLYDLFGEHITDGVHLYELSNRAEMLSNDYLGIDDSMATSSSIETQKRDFYEKFSNLVITQDAIGGVKTSFLIGDQITTRFTPLTFNKTNFKGIRWDIWSSGLQFSALVTRTRPGFVSTKEADGTGSSLVEYPVTETSFDSSYYNRGIRGANDKVMKDFSSRSPYGDYDLLWAVHAENTIANKIDVGISYINHHVSDVKKGEKWIKGDISEGWFPEEVHFEFYDLTPDDTTDAGVYVHEIQMEVNGLPVEPRGLQGDRFRRTFVGDEDGVLLPRDIPISRPQSGRIPIIVAFRTGHEFWQIKGNPKLQPKIKKLTFKYSVAGNYLVFVSTDKQIPLSIYGERDYQTNEIVYTVPNRLVGDIYDRGLKVSESGDAKTPSLTYKYSTTYFGDYIAQSPRKISVRKEEFITATDRNNLKVLLDSKYAYNFNEYSYDYNINVSSVTYGANVRGELLGVKFAGEFALNQSENKLPGGDDTITNKWVGSLKAERELGKSLNLKSDVYFISPQWQTNLSHFQASRYFSSTGYKDPKNKYDDYQSYPFPLNNNWNNIDDNDDKDAFVESDRRRYPSDLNPKDDRDKFWDDGALKYSSDTIEALYLPASQMYIPYDDPDGVVASKNDRNKNGIPDYREDFLLFSSDPPVFELGIDLNNNGVADFEDEDILPDYGYSVGYVVTGDGIKTQGIRGLKLNLAWSPLENMIVDIGGIFEGVVDRDLVLSTGSLEENGGNKKSLFELLNDPQNFEGRSYVGYVNGKLEVLKRSQGLQYEIGGEIRAIKDALRNDAVLYDYRRQGESYNVDYKYYIDPLNYRQSLVSSLIGSITYTNIRNFEYGFRAKLGVEKHFPIDELFHVAYWGGEKWDVFHERLIGEGHAVNRLSYRIGFNNDFEGWRSAFNLLNNLEITPQYKLAFSLRRELQGPADTKDDPRDLARNISLDRNADDTISILDDVAEEADSLLNEWEDYSARNNSYLLNVPILKASYKIAENTRLETGLQFQRLLDFISPEENSQKVTFLTQIVSRANYKGYAVTFYIGGKWYNTDMNINSYDPLTSQGSQHNTRGYEIFAKLYSGI